MTASSALVTMGPRAAPSPGSCGALRSARGRPRAVRGARAPPWARRRRARGSSSRRAWRTPRPGLRSGGHQSRGDSDPRQLGEDPGASKAMPGGRRMTSAVALSTSRGMGSARTSGMAGGAGTASASVAASSSVSPNASATSLFLTLPHPKRARDRRDEEGRAPRAGGAERLPPAAAIAGGGGEEGRGEGGAEHGVSRRLHGAPPWSSASAVFSRSSSPVVVLWTASRLSCLERSIHGSFCASGAARRARLGVVDQHEHALLRVGAGEGIGTHREIGHLGLRAPRAGRGVERRGAARGAAAASSPARGCRAGGRRRRRDRAPPRAGRRRSAWPPGAGRSGRTRPPGRPG